MSLDFCFDFLVMIFISKFVKRTIVSEMYYSLLLPVKETLNSLLAAVA